MKLLRIFVLNDPVLWAETFRTTNTAIVMSFGSLQIILDISFNDAAWVEFRYLHRFHVEFTQIFIWCQFSLF